MPHIASAFAESLATWRARASAVRASGMSPIEIAAFVLGVVNLVLLVRRSIWNYPFALAMVALYAQVFFAAKLYSDALLQIFFFVVNLYGWWQWRRSQAHEGDI